MLSFALRNGIGHEGRGWLSCLAILLLAPLPALAGSGESPNPIDTKELKIVAVVNGESISREALGRECLRHYGKEVLESVMNRYLINEECRQRNITVSREEIDAEIDRMATRFGLPVDQWLKMLKQERGIKPKQYANDIIWPTLALRKLAGSQLQVTDNEVLTEYESQYGPAVRARIIVADDVQQAQKLRETAVANPESFGNLAKDYSKDVNSASTKGMIQPIHKHMGNKEIEQVAFNMKDGEISQVIPLGPQFAVLKRESLLPAASVKLEQVKPRLEEVLRDRKMRTVAQDVFRKLQTNAQVQNVFNDPAARQRNPGVAALINGRAISIQDLAEQCIDRHGEEVLEGTINHKLLEQAAKRAGVTVSEKDIDDEIARAAAAMAKPKADGSTDVEGWLQTVTQQRGISLDVYRNDEVWPSVVLKKLVDKGIVVSDEDVQRGFDANYGPRVRCRAIILNNVRQAQKVWELARKNPTPEFFGELASQYSIEASSKSLNGEVPPIKKFGGQPILEKEAFALKPGELSSIIQAGDKYVILLCEGFTQPVKVEMANVRDLIVEDIREKKIRLAMADRFEELKEQAQVDNYLAGTSHTPKRDDNKLPPGVPTLRQVPARG